MPLRGPVPLLLGAEFSAGVAHGALATALGWQAYERAGDPLVLGLLGLAEFLPALLLALPAGHVADRYDRRHVAFLASLGGSVVAGLLVLDAASGDQAVWPLYLLALAGGVATAFLSPSFNPLLAASVPPAGLARVISLSSITWQSSSHRRAGAGGGLQLLGNPAPYLASAVASTVGARCSCSRCREPSAPRTSSPARLDATWRDVTAGIRFVRSKQALLGAISLDLAAVLFGGATALLPVFATDILHVGAAGNGLLRAAPGVGAIAVGCRAGGMAAAAPGRADPVRRRRPVRRGDRRVRPLDELPALARGARPCWPGPTWSAS